MSIGDSVSQGRADDEWRVTLVERGPWKGPAEERFDRLEARLYACVDAIADGRLAQEYPATAGKKIVVELDGRGLPAAELGAFFDRFSKGIQRIPRYKAALAGGAHARVIAFELKSDQAWSSYAASYLPMQPIKTVIALAHQYERHLSAASMVGGFAFDSYSFGRIDHATTHLVFLAYLVVAGAAIAVSHRLESRPPERQPSERTRTILTAVTQFALGCLLSGFCVFYLRSASLWASWPYLLILAGIFVGNEFFKKYTTRFTLSLLLYFFAILSYAIFLVPVVVAMIGTLPFIASGILALVLFLFYSDLLRWLGRARWRQVRLYVYAGVLVIGGVVNLFYFLKILPPLPLALANAGIYHSVKKVGQVYQVTEEPQPWTTFWGDPPVLHLLPDDKLFLYAAVFAPGRLGTTIVHHWEWFDPAQRRWVPQSRVAFSIRGGRDAGYRAYSIKSRPRSGDWRVNITTGDDRPIGRVRFAVAFGPPSQPLQQKVLN
jgi:MFS family permease